MGGWGFMEPRLRALGFEAAYVGRDASASPATGSLRIHRREQEEPQNMGAWFHMDAGLRGLGYQPQFVGRDASASPATGSHHVHEREQKELVEVALGGPVPHQVRAVPTAVKRPRLDVLETEVKRPAMSPSS